MIGMLSGDATVLIGNDDIYFNGSIIRTRSCSVKIALASHNNISKDHEEYESGK